MLHAIDIMNYECWK